MSNPDQARTGYLNSRWSFHICHIIWPWLLCWDGQEWSVFLFSHFQGFNGWYRGWSGILAQPPGSICYRYNHWCPLSPIEPVLSLFNSEGSAMCTSTRAAIVVVVLPMCAFKVNEHADMVDRPEVPIMRPQMQKVRTLRICAAATHAVLSLAQSFF